MKSKRAKECADRYISTGAYKGVHRYKYVIQAIEFAEQDAEERAVKAFCKATCSSNPCEDSCDDFIEFKQLLNGGQSDE